MLRMSLVFVFLISTSVFPLFAQVEHNEVLDLLRRVSRTDLTTQQFNEANDEMMHLQSEGKIYEWRSYQTWFNAVSSWCKDWNAQSPEVVRATFCRSDYFRNNFAPMILKEGIKRASDIKDALQLIQSVQEVANLKGERWKAILDQMPFLLKLFERSASGVRHLPRLLDLIIQNPVRIDFRKKPLSDPYQIGSGRFNGTSADAEEIPFIGREPIPTQILEYLLFSMKELKLDENHDPSEPGAVLNAILRVLLTENRYEFIVPLASITQVNNLTAIWLIRNSPRSAFNVAPVYFYNSDPSVLMRFPRSIAPIDLNSSSAREVRANWARFGVGFGMNVLMLTGLAVAASSGIVPTEAQGTKVLLGLGIALGTLRCVGSLYNISLALQGRRSNRP